MENEVVIVLAEDDEGHARLIEKNLKRSGIANKIHAFSDGEQTLDFFFQRGQGPHRETGRSYILLLDIRMPKIDGIEVLEALGQDKELSKMPIVMITTTDDPIEVDKCHKLGCSNYIAKPIDYEKFVQTIRNLGLFLKVVQYPKLNGKYSL
ncbi:MAG TPA: response regulator [Desulfohalobiaceae bacterium]|nr:response regulator [Desulfohalobiaceae bacterium]